MQTSGHFSILSRRGFLAGCSGAAACLACPAVCRATAATPQSLVPNERMKLRLVYTHPDPKLEGWPYQGYDYESRKKELTERLRRACPNVDFLPVWAQEEADGKKVLEGDGEVDGYLVYLLGIPSSAARAIVFSGRPAILADDLYGGTGQFLGLYGEALRKGMRVAGVSSSRLTDVADAVHVLEALRKFQRRQSWTSSTATWGPLPLCTGTPWESEFRPSAPRNWTTPIGARTVPRLSSGRRRGPRARPGSWSPRARKSRSPAPCTWACPA